MAYIRFVGPPRVEILIPKGLVKPLSLPSTSVSPAMHVGSKEPVGKIMPRKFRATEISKGNLYFSNMYVYIYMIF